MRSSSVGRRRAGPLVLVLAIIATTLTSLTTRTPAAAGVDDICRISITVTTGHDGLRDDSTEEVRLGGRRVLFEDHDGDFVLDTGDLKSFHLGGTGDRRRASYVWDAKLQPCVPRTALAGGFEFTHIPDPFPVGNNVDNWDLRGLRIADRDTAEVYYRHDFYDSSRTHRFHRFEMNARQTFNTNTVAQTPPSASSPNTVCRVSVTVFAGEDGLRNDSAQEISLGGRRMRFLDTDGDLGPDEEEGDIDPEETLTEQPPEEMGVNRKHRGGTDDTRFATFVWEGRFASCVANGALTGGFTIRHTAGEDFPNMPDKWSLLGVRIVNRDTGAVYVDLDPYNGMIHLFQKNTGQEFNTGTRVPLGDNADTDHDGLTDLIEMRGIPRGDGTTDAYLPEHGSDPCRPTVAVQIDWLAASGGNHGPAPEAMAEARGMFGRASYGNTVNCPYGYRSGSGVQLLTDDLCDPVIRPHRRCGEISVSESERKKPLNVSQDGQPTPYARHREAHFPDHRRKWFFYSLWGFAHNTTDSGGTCCLGALQNDFLVTLGDRPSVRAQSATFVHELGHELGLGHGGGDDVAYKPNYLSVMNYHYSFTGIPDFGRWRDEAARLGPLVTDDELSEKVVEVSTLDYSSAELSPLNRRSLDEQSGVGSGARNQVVLWSDDSGALHAADGGGGIDWDWSTGGRAATGIGVSADINATFQQCVKIDGELHSTLGGTNHVRGDYVIAGRDGVCRTTATPPDKQLRTDFGTLIGPGFDYPARYGYATAMTGYDDWSRIKFRIGESPDARVPLPWPREPAMSRAEAERQVVEIGRALLAAVAPAPQAPRWGFAYMDQATPALGVETALVPRWQWSTATTGRHAGVVRTATGEYTVRLPDLASPQGIAHVTPFRTTYRGRTCRVTGYEPSGPDEMIKVGCFNEAGAPVDWWFMVSFTAPSAGGVPYTTVRYDAPGGGGTMNPVWNDGTYNSAGLLNAVHREGTGRYRVVLNGTPYAADTGYAQVTPYGTGSPARCHTEGTRPAGDALEVTVACYALASDATPRPVDARWLLSYVQRGGLHGTASPAAYLTTTGDPASPAVDARHSFSSNGETPALARLGTGWYRVTYSGVGKEPDSVQVSTNTPGRYCHLGNWNSYSAAPQVTMDVYCHSADGVRADGNFGIAYLRAP
ncbi:hypothetical protein [Streptosporangium roseum]|uniref:hypothetical protein n=1 Tax=Streptosporangium roseum TaxID=2001 RepID=UPI003330BDD1